MYRVLIVDDEPIIVNSMYRLLREAVHLDLEAYRAYNVYEALDCMQQVRIDVVISDIRMPGMSGIELHKKIAQSWPRCKVIFLTGYNEADYARHAIRTGGVVDYVLKNEDDHVILAAVEKAFAELDEVEYGVDYMMNAKKKLQLAIPALQKNTLFDLMRNPSLSLQEIEARFAKSEIPLAAREGVFLVLGRVDIWPMVLSDLDRTLLIYACQNIAEEYLDLSVEHVFVVFETNKFLWFMQPKELKAVDPLNEEQKQKAWQNLRTRVYGIIEAVQQTCRQLLKLPLSFVIGRDAYEWENVGAQFHYLKALLGNGSHNRQELLIQDSDQFGLHMDSGRSHPFSDSMNNKKQFELLEQYLSSGQTEQFNKLYDEIMNADDLPGYKYQLELFYSVSLSLISYAIRAGLFNELSVKMDLGKMTQYDAHESWPDAVTYLAKVADYVLEQYEPAADEQGERLILAIHQYTQAHLGGDLSLTKLSTVVHHSPTYLSRLYKRMTGTMLSDYITKERMKKAQQQLAETSMKIGDIATHVGYEAAPQFNRSFKKMFKLTPQEYRDRFQTMQE